MSRESLLATPSQTVGPFFHFGLRDAQGRAAAVNADRTQIHVRVIDGAGAPVADALVEFWSRADGDSTAESGRVSTGEDGSCLVEVVRAARCVHVCLFARGLLHHVFTRIYFAGN